MTPQHQQITVPQFLGFKRAGHKICVVTAYDYPTAELVDAAGVDAVLVGDSLAMAVQGHASTLPVSLDEMIYHAEMVGRAVRRALVVVDMPFPSNHLGPYKAVESAGRILKETRCHAVKLEGGADQADVIKALVTAGIPVMAHCGLRPQSVHVLGGYKVQRDEAQLMADARAAEDAGAFAMVLECIPAEMATTISASVRIPTIGIGAGPGTDGQVLVINDLLGMTSGYVPRFVRAYADLKSTITDAVKHYCDDVRGGKFPGPEQTFR
ncbi:MAG: 3-methyl-2-oxobutanoate hydroxymethyltransferase [Pirellulales bacterium]